MKRALHISTKNLAGFLFGVGVFLSAITASGQNDRLENHKYNGIAVLTVAGAHCTMSRDGKVLAELQLTEKLRLTDYVSVDVTENHHDVLITCKRAGYHERTVTNVFGPTQYVDDHPPCAAPPDISGSELRACMEAAKPTTETRMEYHEISRIPLDLD